MRGGWRIRALARSNASYRFVCNDFGGRKKVCRANVTRGGDLIIEIKSNIVLFCLFITTGVGDVIADVKTLPVK
jgi:hypothetical protein